MVDIKRNQCNNCKQDKALNYPREGMKLIKNKKFLKTSPERLKRLNITII